MPEGLVISERYLESIIIICTYGSAVLSRNINELHLLDVLVFFVFILFLTLCGTLFSPQFQVTETVSYICKCFPKCRFAGSDKWSRACTILVWNETLA